MAAAVFATAGLASFLIRKKLHSRKENINNNYSSPDDSHHLTEVFAKAKSALK